MPGYLQEPFFHFSGKTYFFSLLSTLLCYAILKDEHARSCLCRTCSGSCCMCFSPFMEETGPCSLATSPGFLPTGKKSQPVSRMSMCPWPRDSSEVFLQYLSPDHGSRGSVYKCQSVSHFQWNRLGSPWTELISKPSLAHLFGGSHRITSWLLADEPVLSQCCDSWQSLMLSWLNISVRSFPCGEIYVCFRLI